MMKKTVAFALLALMSGVLTGCKKEEPAPVEPPPASKLGPGQQFGYPGPGPGPGKAKGGE